MNESRFDEGRSAAIRDMLIQTVDAEPARARRVHLRIAVLAILAAIGVTFGGTAVAVAVSGGSLFTVGAPAPAATSASPVPSPSSTTTATPVPTPTASAHPLVITGDRILPHDIVSAPLSSPLWSVDLPTVGDVAPGCANDTVIDVSDGYALVQRRVYAKEDVSERCAASENRMALALVDTAAGAIVWDREWRWATTEVDSTSARLLGTSGRVLIWEAGAGDGPAEVLDLATGETLGAVTVPEGFAVRELYSVPGDSGDVSYATVVLDAGGQETTAWSVRRADPLALDRPRWSHDIETASAMPYGVGNTSSILNVLYERPDGPLTNDVLDVDTGAVMATDVGERSYTYFDGFTLREAGFTTYGVPSSVAGIDDAGNEFWSRESATGIVIGRVDLPGQKPAGFALNEGSDIALATAGNQLELVDGLTGQTKWTTDASACGIDPASFGKSVAGFTLQPDGVMVAVYQHCAFDYATGAAVDIGARRDPGLLGSAVAYELSGGWATGGRAAIDGVVPGAGTATAFDAVTGDVLWTLPIASDELWESAGGYVVGISDGRMFGIG